MSNPDEKFSIMHYWVDGGVEEGGTSYRMLFLWQSEKYILQQKTIKERGDLLPYGSEGWHNDQVVPTPVAAYINVLLDPEPSY